ncbi:DUF4214 domain-containing protein [Actinotalea sp. M2MS4P-6]|uniref:DUF4214 domain-containing protein n=1 Tax=Actinotalea sp. M2MS4P-6 TaxID=2983762 RepID=UPI0021E35D00|nr:DUF4214 domain-containing protein [Actinotalea sp. M2MS4P-6]MCV2393865.1 DUF4214 domain-containing protein [Actinotalea sp. M2MS4P-6]
MRPHRWVIPFLVGGLLAATAMPAQAAEPAPDPAPEPVTATTTTAEGVVYVYAQDMLEALWIDDENTSTYSRSSFNYWIDADRDGCDTRAEVLLAESMGATSGGCPVKTGSWYSYYDGASWTLASDVDINHMVPPAEAWDSGAWAWSAAQREAFANDLAWPASLVAITDDLSASKGEKDPAEWMPPSADATCRYVSEWVSVKYRWNLTMDWDEYDALADELYGDCADSVIVLPAIANVPEPLIAIHAYIKAVYHDLFHRSPDSTGLATWTTKLQTGTPYGEVANGITYSDEYRSRLIQASYRRYLGRSADASGQAFWLDKMRNGWHIEQMQSGFIASDEFYARGGGTDAGWVRLLYRTVLGRSAGSSEVAYWVGEINGGRTRQSVALGFLYSTEHLTDVVDGYYVDLLGRHIDPTGRTFWVTQIQQGARDEQIIAGIVSSDEYRWLAYMAV